MSEYACYKKLVDDALEAHRFAGPEALTEAMRYALLGGGKRLRGVLALAFAEAAGQEKQLALPCAKAVEMIHAYSLVHDDLPAMDNDVLRRGKPTCHVAFGEARAILAGDALLTEAFGCLAGMGGDVIALFAACAGSAGMVGGQELDLAGGADSSRKLYELDRLKTGALIRCACVSGVMAAHGDARLVAAAEKYALHLGVCFQMVDDLLDAEGSAQALGKSVGKDANAGKVTYYSLLGREDLNERIREETDEAVSAAEGLPNGAFLSELALNMARRDR